MTFLSCKFYECEIVDELPAGPVYILGGTSFPEIYSLLVHTLESEDAAGVVNPALDADRTILRRFWPIGESLRQKPSRPIYRPMKFLCQTSEEFTSSDLYHSVERLKKRGILMEMSKSSLITLSQDALTLAQDIIGDSQ